MGLHLHWSDGAIQALICLEEHLDSPVGHKCVEVSQVDLDGASADRPSVPFQALHLDKFGHPLVHDSSLFELEHDSDSNGHDIALPPAASSDPSRIAPGLIQHGFCAWRAQTLGNCEWIGHKLPQTLK